MATNPKKPAPKGRKPIPPPPPPPRAPRIQIRKHLFGERVGYMEFHFKKILKAFKKKNIDEIDDHYIHSACMYYRHDYGLLSGEEQSRIRYEAEKWLQAWYKVAEDKGR